MTLLARLALGLGISVTIALLALWRRSLSPSGVLGAILVGTAIFGFGGPSWGLTLIAFFVSSSALSRYREAAKAVVAQEFAKGSRRDLGQALANGGAGALLALAHQLWPQPALLAAFAGAMASVTADTWATELGVLSRRPPRLITTWQPVTAGTSGGVSARGTLAAAAGALAIGLTLLLLLSLDGDATCWVVPAALLGGLAGCTVDSLLGATVQAMYWSDGRLKETERRLDPDGTPNRLLRGYAWLGNDAVNLASSLAGAAAGAGVWDLVGRA